MIFGRARRERKLIELREQAGAMFHQRLKECERQAKQLQYPLPGSMTIDDVFALIAEVGDQSFDDGLVYASSFMLNLAACYADPAACEIEAIAATMQGSANVLDLFSAKFMMAESAKLTVLMAPLIATWKSSGRLEAANRIAGVG